MQELVISDYFKRYYIDPQMDEASHLKVQQTTFEGKFTPYPDDQNWVWDFIDLWLD